MRVALCSALVLCMAALASGEGPDPIAGEWTVLTVFGGAEMESKLVVTRGEHGSLAARYTDSRGGVTALQDVKFEGGVLTFNRKAGPRVIGFEGKVSGDRMAAQHLLGARKIPAFAARGAEALAALKAERAKANERGSDLEEDYRRHSRRVVARDAFPVLFDPKLTPAAEAKGIRDDEPVIGVAINGEAKAYPIIIMGRHELANDTCGGIPIAASW